MSYPGDFDTTMFPGTRYLAMARAFAIWSAVLFLLIAGLAGMLWWMMGSVRADPVLIQISDNGKTWTAMISSESDKLQYPAHRTFQEATIGNFAKMWFEISGAGEIVATDNGNPADMVSFASKERNAFGGLALVIVRGKKGETGEMRLTVKAESLDSDSLIINSR